MVIAFLRTTLFLWLGIQQDTRQSPHTWWLTVTTVVPLVSPVGCQPLWALHNKFQQSNRWKGGTILEHFWPHLSKITCSAGEESFFSKREGIFQKYYIWWDKTFRGPVITVQTRSNLAGYISWNCAFLSHFSMNLHYTSWTPNILIRAGAIGTAGTAKAVPHFRWKKWRTI